MSIDGQFPRIFSKVNRHGVPGFAMGFNVICLIALVFTGGALEIYSLSNSGYTVSFIPVLVALLPVAEGPACDAETVSAARVLEVHRACSWRACTSSSGRTAGLWRRAAERVPGQQRHAIYFFIGWAILLSYLLLYWYRKRVEDPKYAGAARGGRPAGERRATEVGGGAGIAARQGLLPAGPVAR